MRLTHDQLLKYQGLNGIDGICHIRIYEGVMRSPVVIAGELDDNPGTSITNAIEMVAHAIQHQLLNGRRKFTLIEHHPDTITRSGEPTFARVQFQRTHPQGAREEYAGRLLVAEPEGTIQSELSAPRRGSVRAPKWQPLNDIEKLVGCTVHTWPSGQYTARAVAGSAGKGLRDQTALRAAATASALISRVAEITGDRNSGG